MSTTCGAPKERIFLCKQKGILSVVTIGNQGDKKVQSADRSRILKKVELLFLVFLISMGKKGSDLFLARQQEIKFCLGLRKAKRF